MTNPTQEDIKPWWEVENELMNFKSIDHAPGIITNTGSQPYDEMMEYLDIKLANQRAQIRDKIEKYWEQFEHADLNRIGHGNNTLNIIDGQWGDNQK